MTAQRLWARTRALWNGRRLDEQLDDEIRVHLELAQEDAMAHGLSAEDARLDALRKFGRTVQIKEEHRDRRAFAPLDNFLRDFRYGLASIRRAPGFTAIVVLVLALGIGGAVAMFSVVDAILIKPIPFPDPDRIVGLWEAPHPGASNATTAGQFVAWQRLASDFEFLEAEEPILVALNDKNGPTRLSGKLVTPEYFRVYGINAAIGRTFDAGDSKAASSGTVVLSHAAWQTYFGGDPGILQRRIILDGRSCQVIGVLRPSAFDRDETKFWQPLVFTSADLSNDNHWLMVLGRLKAGVTVRHAMQQMQAIYAALLPDRSMDENSHGSMVVRTLSQMLMGNSLERSISIAFGAVLLVLLIACANVANLLFARGAARRTELGVRFALGAGRPRLIAQLLTECTALCALGGAVGIAVAFALIGVAGPVLDDALPFTANVTLDFHALVFAAAAVLSIALFTGTFPALQASSDRPSDSLKQTARGSSVARIAIRRAIVTGEVALSLILLSGALLLVRSLDKLRHVETGVRIENVVTTSLNLPEQAYSTPERAAIFYTALTNRLSTAPGVLKAGLSTYLPLQWVSNGEGILLPGIENQVMIRLKRVDPGYFRTFDIPVLRGRGILDTDRVNTPAVMVINQTLQSRLAEVAHITQPIGKIVRLTNSGYLGRDSFITQVQIVGVIRSERTTSPGAPDPAVVYVPLAQMPTPNIMLSIHTRPGTQVLSAIRWAVADVDPNLPLGPIASMEEIRDSTFSGVSRPAGLLTGFASIAALLCAIGLYGVVSYSVTQRRRELGIRIALGADRVSVISDVIRNAMAMVAIGLAAGLAGAYVLTRVLSSLLFKVSPLDPLSLTLACISMLAIGAFAGMFPAWRAARFDVVVSLRDA